MFRAAFRATMDRVSALLLAASGEGGKKRAASIGETSGSTKRLRPDVGEELGSSGSSDVANAGIEAKSYASGLSLDSGGIENDSSMLDATNDHGGVESPKEKDEGGTGSFQSAPSSVTVPSSSGGSGPDSTEKVNTEQDPRACRVLTTDNSILTDAGTIAGKVVNTVDVLPSHVMNKLKIKAVIEAKKRPNGRGLDDEGMTTWHSSASNVKNELGEVVGTVLTNVSFSPGWMAHFINVEVASTAVLKESAGLILVDGVADAGLKTLEPVNIVMGCDGSVETPFALGKVLVTIQNNIEQTDSMLGSNSVEDTNTRISSNTGTESSDVQEDYSASMETSDWAAPLNDSGTGSMELDDNVLPAGGPEMPLVNDGVLPAGGPEMPLGNDVAAALDVGMQDLDLISGDPVYQGSIPDIWEAVTHFMDDQNPHGWVGQQDLWNVNMTGVNSMLDTLKEYVGFMLHAHGQITREEILVFVALGLHRAMVWVDKISAVKEASNEVSSGTVSRTDAADTLADRFVGG